MASEYLNNAKLWISYLLARLEIWGQKAYALFMKLKKDEPYLLAGIGFLFLLLIAFAVFRRKKPKEEKEAKEELPVLPDAEKGQNREEETVSFDMPELKEETQEKKEDGEELVLVEEPEPLSMPAESLPESMMLEEYEMETALPSRDGEGASEPAVMTPAEEPRSVTDFVNSLKSDLEAELISLVRRYFPARLNFKERYAIKDEIKSKCFDLIEKLRPLELNNYPFKKDYFAAKSVYFWVTDNMEELKKNLERALTVYPSDDALLIQNAVFLTQTDRASEAEAFLLKAREANPGNFDSLFLLGEIQFGRNNFYEALQLFKKVILLDPENSAAYAYKGFILASRGYISEGERDLKKAVSLNCRNDLAFLFLGNIYKQLNFFAKAVPMYKKAFELGCHHRELPENYAFCLFHLKKYTLVVSQLAPLYHDGLLTAGGMEVLGDSYAELEEYDRAIAVLEKAAELSPEKGVFRRLGELYLKTGRPEKALEAFPRAMDEKNRLEIQLRIGKIYFQSLKQYENAEKYYVLALEADKNNFEILYNLLQVSYYKKDYPGCVKLFEQLAGHPEYRIVPEILFKAGIAYSRTGQFDQAVKLLSKAESLGFVDEELFNALAYASYKQGKVNKAVDEYRKSIVVNSFNPATYNNLGVIYAQQEDYNSAIREFKQALSIDKENKEALFNLYKAYKILSRSEADKYLSQLKEVI